MVSAVDSIRIAEYRKLVRQLGQAVTWTAQDGAQTATVQMGYKTPTTADSPVVASIGIGGAVFTACAEDLPQPPVKFDTFQIAGQTFVADTVRPAIIADQVVGWRIIARGK